MMLGRRLLALNCAFLVLFAGLTTGCLPADRNPVAALSAVEKVQTAIAAIESGADPFAAIQAVLDQLNAGELASAANLLGGLNLSVGDAQDVLDLVALIDPATLESLEASGIDVTDPNGSPADVAAALHDAGHTEVTPEQVALFFELLAVFKL
jgi:hypothetical protein